MTPAERYVMGVHLRAVMGLFIVEIDQMTLDIAVGRDRHLILSSAFQIGIFDYFLIDLLLKTYNDWMRWGNGIL